MGGFYADMPMAKLPHGRINAAAERKVGLHKKGLSVAAKQEELPTVEFPTPQRKQSVDYTETNRRRAELTENQRRRTSNRRRQSTILSSVNPSGGEYLG